MNMIIRDLSDIVELENVQEIDFRELSSTYALFKQRARLAPEALALTFFNSVEAFEKSSCFTYQEFFKQINKAANALRRIGIERRDVVAFILPNLPQTHFVIWGAETAGVVFAVNPLMESATIRHLLSSTEAKAVVTLSPSPDATLWNKVVESIHGLNSIELVITVRPSGNRKDAEERSLAPLRHPRIPIYDLDTLMFESDGEALNFSEPLIDDIASYFCTGGTTGAPKIAVRTHRTEVANAVQLAQVFRSAVKADNPTVFAGLPLFHVNAQIVTGLAAWGAGAHVIVGTPAGFRTPGLIQNFWKIVQHYKISTFSAVPTVYASLLQVEIGDCDLSSLELGFCGAAPMPFEIYNRFTRETGIKLLEGYGLTEAGCVSTINPPNGLSKIGSIGIRLPWQDLHTVHLDEEGNYIRDANIDEVGALVINGPNVFIGYLNSDNNKNLWIKRPCSNGGSKKYLITGDLARVDSEGYFWLAGRTKELIIRAGHNIDPRSIEEVLCTHPSVSLAAAVGRPDSHAGEVPVAYVQVRPGFLASSEEILEYVSKRIPERAATPKSVRILPSLPTTTVGKIFKPALVELEIADVVKREAQEAGVDLEYLRVTQNPRSGWEVKWAGKGDLSKLRDKLALYTFRQAERLE